MAPRIVTASLLLASLASLGGCDQFGWPSASMGDNLSNLKATPPPLDAVEANRIMDTAQSIAGPRTKIRAVCGHLIGAAYWGLEKGWVSDGVSASLAIVQDSEGNTDVIRTDAVSGYKSVVSEGATVKVVQDNGDEMIFTIINSGGPAENFLIKGSGYSAIVITTVVKGEFGPLPARGSILIASCYVPT